RLLEEMRRLRVLPRGLALL
ncbi:hypothetical protein A2U01_0084090, partial [Trifolium medium]|nr:hypothetical protein [Trifolium medium]